MPHGPSPRAAIAALVLLAWIPAPAPGADPPPLPDSRLGVRTAPLLLLSRPDVQADLGLTPEQTASAQQTITSLYVQATALKGRPDAEALAARRAIDAAQRRWLEERLTTAQQDRLVQIDLQWEGPSALITRPLVAEALGLSAAQRTTLAAAIARRHRLRSQGEDRPEDERPLAEQALATLTPEQKERWRAMLGRPFVVQTATAPESGPRR
jgi:hypothetical protein